MKTGRGGIRDIEYTVQFLQLLNGGDLPAVRQRNTLLALEALEIAGCLNSQETYILSPTRTGFCARPNTGCNCCSIYKRTRLPAAEGEELRKLARRMGYLEKESGVRGQGSGSRNQEAETSKPQAEESEAGRGARPNSTPAPLARSPPQKRSPLDESDPPPLDTREPARRSTRPVPQGLYTTKLRIDRTILNHLLHQSFQGEDGRSEPEAGPDPRSRPGRRRPCAPVLGRYPFRDIPKAFANLSGACTRERSLSFGAKVPALPREHRAAVAPRGRPTPPTPTRRSPTSNASARRSARRPCCGNCSASNPDRRLELYVELCAGSPFLSGLLINNPGMVDELLDSLVFESAASGRRTPRGTHRTAPRRDRPRSDLCTASRTRSSCASVSAICSTRPTCGSPPPRFPTWPTPS